jgi:hypothetical protein
MHLTLVNYVVFISHWWVSLPLGAPWRCGWLSQPNGLGFNFPIPFTNQAIGFWDWDLGQAKLVQRQTWDCTWGNVKFFWGDTWCCLNLSFGASWWCLAFPFETSQVLFWGQLNVVLQHHFVLSLVNPNDLESSWEWFCPGSHTEAIF